MSSWPSPSPDYSDLTNFTFDADVSSTFPHIPWSHRVALALYAAIFLLGVPGNMAVIWLSSTSQRRAVPAVWYLHLAIADLLCCLALPFLAIPVAGDHRWPLGDVGCKLFPALAVINMYASVLLLAAISADRYLIVTKPAWCHNHRTPRRAHQTSLTIWLCSILLTVPTFLFRSLRRDPFADAELCAVDFGTAGAAKTVTAILRFTAGFLLPFASITVCHTVLLSRLRHRGVNRIRGAVGTVLAVVVTFFVCWLPFHVIGLILTVSRANTDLYRRAAILDPVFTGLAYANSCANPVIYAAAAGRRKMGGKWGEKRGDGGRGASWCAALRRVLSEEPNGHGSTNSRSYGNAGNAGNANTVDTEV